MDKLINGGEEQESVSGEEWEQSQKSSYRRWVSDRLCEYICHILIFLFLFFRYGEMGRSGGNKWEGFG